MHHFIMQNLNCS